MSGQPPNGQVLLGSRALFADLQVPIYANFAGISPPSQPVQAAAQAQLLDVARRGSGSFGAWIHQRNELRTQLATLIGCGPEALGLVHNTTWGLMAVALGIDLQPGERVLCVQNEFPANVVPWQQAAARGGGRVDFVTAPEAMASVGVWLDAVRCQLRQGARLLAVSAVRFQSGWQAPLAELAELCHSHGAQLAVDGVQALGVVPLDVVALDVDYLACGSHKWLMGPEGAGLLYVHPRCIGPLRKTLAGWLSLEDPVDFLIRGPGLLRHDKAVRDRADFVEGANISAMSCAGLGASVMILQQLTIPAIYSHVQTWQDRLDPHLSRLGLTSLRPAHPARRSGILACLPPPGIGVVDLQRRLGDLGVTCSIPDGNLRFSAHWPSPLEEVDLLAERLAEALDDLTRMS